MFLVLIVIYLSIAFEWKMAVAAFIALAHDIVITTGIYALAGFQVSPATVIGLLTILGYSLYDTVVVFDKVRENTAGLLATERSTYSQAANLALNQTLVRSINTSLIALLPVTAILLVAVIFLGTGELQDLSLVLFVGMLSGTYSSICIATPVLAALKEREPRYKQLTRRVALRASGGRAAQRARAKAEKAGAAGRSQGTAGGPGPGPAAGNGPQVLAGSDADMAAEPQEDDYDEPGRRRDGGRRARRAGPRHAGGVRRLGAAGRARRPAGAATAAPQDQRGQAPARARRSAGKVATVSSGLAPSAEPSLPELIRTKIRDIPDYPQPGIVFKDITPLLADGPAFAAVVAALAAGQGDIRKVVGIEARGFILAAPVACCLRAGFVPVRKEGKLPAESYSESFQLEYGSATVEVHTDAFEPGERVLIVDDVLATGGTAAAAASLVRRSGAQVAGVAVLLELGFLGGRASLPGLQVRSLLTV